MPSFRHLLSILHSSSSHPASKAGPRESHRAPSSCPARGHLPATGQRRFARRAGVSSAPGQRRLVERLAGPARRPRWQPGGGGPRTNGAGRPLRRRRRPHQRRPQSQRLVAAPRPAETRGGIRRLVAGSRQRQPARPAPVPPRRAQRVPRTSQRRSGALRRGPRPRLSSSAVPAPSRRWAVARLPAQLRSRRQRLSAEALEPRRTAGIPQPGQPAVRHGLRADPRPAAVQPDPVHQPARSRLFLVRADRCQRAGADPEHQRPWFRVFLARAGGALVA